MNNVINFQQYKIKKQQELFNSKLYDFFSNMFNLWLDYVVRPIVAAVLTVKQRKIIIV